jgi:predicted porin
MNLLKGNQFMKKTLVALAVSSVAASSVTAFAAEDTTKFDTYGNIQLVYANSDDNGSELGDNGSTFGFQGSTAISQGLTGFFKYELEADADEKNSDVDLGLDQAFAGLKGSFGKVQVGSFDSIYNNAIQDGVDQFEYLGFGGSSLTSEGDTIAYFSPSFNGLEIQASAQIKGGDDSANSSSELDDAGTTATSESGTATTLVAKYTLDALTLAVGYDDLSTTVGGEATYGFSAAYQLSPALVLKAKYEEQDDDSVMGIATRYAYGMGDLYASYEAYSMDAGEDYDEYGVGASYNLASNMYVYAEYGQQGSAEDTVMATGATYLF